MSVTNPYCEALGISVPRLEDACRSSDANYYSLLIACLLEKGGPITLPEAAKRFEEAGVAPAHRALASLKRCKPARAPVYRDGDRYCLDPHDSAADFWAFRLGLRPSAAAALQADRPAPPDRIPLPSPDEPLLAAHVEEAWSEGVPGGWSGQRIAVCVLDAHGASMKGDEAVAFVAACSGGALLSTDTATYWRRGAPIRVRDGGWWDLDRTHEAVRAARVAVRERIRVVRRWADMRTDPAVVEATRRHIRREREKNAERLARMSRVLIHAFPSKAPRAVVLVDVGRRRLSTFLGEEIAEVRRKLESYDIIGAVDVRSVLRSLEFEPGSRRLAELGPPQKSIRLNKRGRTLKITTTLLARGSCGISRPFGDEKVLRGYLREGKATKLRRRLEADAKSLYALYQYGRLHGAVRLRWGFLDERIPAPWAHHDEPTLYTIMTRASELDVALEIVAGSAPGWADPWSRVRRAYVEEDERGWRRWLVDEDGYGIDEADVQLARCRTKTVR